MTNSIFIKKINCTVKHESLIKPFITALHEVDEVQAVKVKIELSNGMIGIGTATPNEKVTGDSLNSTLIVAREVITPQILNKDIFNWNSILSCLKYSVLHNTPAKAAFEIALFDLRSQLFGVSFTNLLGSNKYSPVRTDYTISIGPKEKMVSDAKKKVAEGFHSIKIKLGSHSLKDDILLVSDMGKELGNDVSLRLDINQGWDVKDTLRAIDTWYKKDLNISFVEQPINRLDIKGMRMITSSSPIKIMADESVFSADDALQITRDRACDFINIKLMKSGGLSEAEKINSIAEMAGVHCMIGCMIESRESIAAAVSFASSHENVIFADLDSVYMSGDNSNKGFSIKNDTLIPSKKVGLGFEND